MVTDADKTPPTDEEPRDGEIAQEPLADELAPMPAAETPASGPLDSQAEAAADAIRVDLPSLEALLFSTHHPLTVARLAELLDVKIVKPVRDAVRELNRQYETQHRAFRVEQVAGGYQLLTLPAFAELIKKHQQKEADAKLGKAALETLAVIAYKQPILRVDVEAVRGVACGETIRGLMEKHLVKIAGRAEVPGRPILYGTTKRFLEVFGLNTIKDLPEQEDALAAKAKEMRSKRTEAAKIEPAEPPEPEVAIKPPEPEPAPVATDEELPPRPELMDRPVASPPAAEASDESEKPE